MLGPALLHRVMQYTCSDTIHCDMRILVVTPYTDLITTTTKSNFWKRACAVHTLIAVLIWRELVSSCNCVWRTALDVTSLATPPLCIERAGQPD